MVFGASVSTVGMLLLTQLSATSGYVALLAPLMLFGAGNGLAFVPLTSASLTGVRQEDAGAASGLVNVMQQLGGALGLAVLVSVFGTAARGIGLQSAAAAQPRSSPVRITRSSPRRCSSARRWWSSLWPFAGGVRPRATAVEEPNGCATWNTLGEEAS